MSEISDSSQNTQEVKRGRGRPRGSGDKGQRRSKFNPNPDSVALNNKNNNPTNLMENESQFNNNSTDEIISVTQEEPKFEQMTNPHTDTQFSGKVTERGNVYEKEGDGNGDDNGDNTDSGFEFNEAELENNESDEAPEGFGGNNKNEQGGSFDNNDTGGDDERGNLSDLNPRAKNEAIKKTAKYIAGAYQQVVPKGAQWVAKVSKGQVASMQAKGDIHPNMRLDTPDGGSITFAGIVSNYNRQVIETLIITDAEREEVEDCLVDVLKEHQIAMTPTQRLIAVVGLQMVQLAGTAMSMKADMANQLDMLKNIWQDMKNGGGVKNQTSNSQAPPPNQSSDDSNKNSSADETIKEKIKEKENTGDDSPIDINAEEVKVK